ncbi:hypothetical protein IHE45_09G030400 [Dioscorea alata]|uniref:Uncharacterized protein n=1 Tax=Dioscorea alata TaxID=55571 RepID=A0ACB7VEG9_DIOAL|nr:hypothetical protein IHE45_09G030400 [Dioscorea alata]
MGGLARRLLGGQRGTTRTARRNRGAGGRAAPPRERRHLPIPGQGPSGPPAATRTRHGRAGNVPSDGGRRARTTAAPNREGHRRPAADGVAPLRPAPCAMGGLARHLLGGQRGTTRTARRNRGTGGRAAPPRERRHLPTPGQGPSGPPAATRTRHGRAGNVPSGGGSPRAHPRRTQPRGTPAPRRGRRGTVGARSLCNGRVSAAPTRRAAGHDAHGPAKPGDRGTGGTTARAEASPDPRPRSEWPTGSHPDSPWTCGQCP